MKQCTTPVNRSSISASKHLEQLVEGLADVNDDGELALFGPIQLNAKRLRWMSKVDVSQCKSNPISPTATQGCPRHGGIQCRFDGRELDSHPSCTWQG